MSSRRVGRPATCHCGAEPRDGVITATKAVDGQPEGRALYVQLDGDEPHICLRATPAARGGARPGAGRPSAGTHLPRLPITPAIHAAAQRAELTPSAWADRVLSAASEGEPCSACGSWTRCPCHGPPSYRSDPEQVRRVEAARGMTLLTKLVG